MKKPITPANSSEMQNKNLYNDYINLKLFNGSFTDYLNLSALQYAELKNALKALKNRYYSFSQDGLFTGTIYEFAALDENQLLELELKQLLAMKKKILNYLEETYTRLQSCDEQDFPFLTELYEKQKAMIEDYNINERPRLLEMAAKLGIMVSKEMEQLVITDIIRPRFGILDNKKYKILDDLLTDDYLFKLKTYQIDGVFSSANDYNSKDKWKEFIDKKETEYNELRKENKYYGSFQDYLHEDVITTLNLIRFNKRINPADEIARIQSQSDTELKNIMNGNASQALTNNAFEYLHQVINENKNNSKGRK